MYVCNILYCLIYVLHLHVQEPEPEVREHFISVMSDIVSFHSKRLEHLVIRCESCQLCMSMECNIFLLVCVNIIESVHLNIVTCDSH